MSMTSAEAIKTYFNTDGYPEVGNRELIACKKADKAEGTEHYREIATLCAEALGVELG